MWRLGSLLAVIAATAVAARVLRVPLELEALREWVRGLGPLGPLALILMRGAAAVALLPGSAVSVAAGALLGPALGVVVVSAGKALGAGVAFLISRYLARDAVGRWLSQKGKLRRFDAFVGTHGALVVAVMRLLPVIPFSVQNYAFGLTPIGFGTYLFWSWLCMLPGAVIVVVGTDVILKTLASGKVPWGLLGVLAGATLVMGGLGAYALLKLRARSTSRRAAPPARGERPESP